MGLPRSLSCRAETSGHISLRATPSWAHPPSSDTGPRDRLPSVLLGDRVGQNRTRESNTEHSYPEGNNNLLFPGGHDLPGLASARQGKKFSLHLSKFSSYQACLPLLYLYPFLPLIRGREWLRPVFIYMCISDISLYLFNHLFTELGISSGSGLHPSPFSCPHRPGALH